MLLSKRNLLLLAVAVIVLANVWLFIVRRRPAPPTADHPRLVPGVAMRDVTFYSNSLRRDMQYRVFLPEDAGNQKLAVVYLLHGGGGSGFRDWSNYSDV